MKILVACEMSGVVRDAFRAKGHDAYSCDILNSHGDNKFHIKGDVTPLLRLKNIGPEMANMFVLGYGYSFPALHTPRRVRG